MSLKAGACWPETELVMIQWTHDHLVINYRSVRHLSHTGMSVFTTLLQIEKTIKKLLVTVWLISSSNAFNWTLKLIYFLLQPFHYRDRYSLYLFFIIAILLFSGHDFTFQITFDISGHASLWCMKNWKDNVCTEKVDFISGQQLVWFLQQFWSPLYLFFSSN